LAGDVDGNNAVTIDDFRANRVVQFFGAADAGYSPRHDVDGNGAINIVDWAEIRRRIGTNLPAPAPAASSAASIVSASIVSLATPSHPPAVAAPGDRPALRLSSRAVDRAVSEAVDEAAAGGILSSRDRAAGTLDGFGSRLLRATRGRRATLASTASFADRPNAVDLALADAAVGATH
jgi:hypothetical protein